MTPDELFLYQLTRVVFCVGMGFIIALVVVSVMEIIFIATKETTHDNDEDM